MIEINYDRAAELLREAVALRGEDTVINVCQYARGGKPHCLIGQALALAGVPQVQLERMDDISANGVQIASDYYFPHGHAEFGFELIGSEAAALFRKAQDRQDLGAPWGYVIEQLLPAVA